MIQLNKGDIIANGRYFRLIIIYGVILGIVYGYWMYKENLPIWSFILVCLGFVGLAVLFAFIYVEVVSRKSKKQEEVSSEEASPDSAN